MRRLALPGYLVNDVRAFRADSTVSFAALYHPWVLVADPLGPPGGAAPPELALPPCGFVAGLMARNASRWACTRRRPTWS